MIYGRSAPVNVGLTIAIFNTLRNSPLNLGMLFNGDHVINTINVIATMNMMMIKLDTDFLVSRRTQSMRNISYHHCPQT